MKIYRGGKICCEEPIDDPAYNRPGRRGLAMTCCEEVTFCICTDCEDVTEECLVWDIEKIEGPDDFNVETDIQFRPEEFCNAVTLDVINCPKKFVELHVTVTDVCHGDLYDEVYVYLGRVTLGLGKTYAHPNTETADIDLLLTNPENHVRAIQVDVCADAYERCPAWGCSFQAGECSKKIDEEGCDELAYCTWSDLRGCRLGYCTGDLEEEMTICHSDEDCPAGESCVFDNCKLVNDVCVAEDNMECTECVVSEDRTPEYVCSAHEITDAENNYGCCRVTLYSTEPNDLIQQGDGAVARIKYDILGEETSKEHIPLWPFKIKVSDQFNGYLCACPSAGKIEFRVCGDVYPQDCYECQTCGDGKVDIFDILEDVDIILGIQTASECQKMDFHGDVPLGMPPYCGEPAGITPPNCLTDGVIDIFDALVIIDKALSRVNCCDYCMYGEIY